MKQRQTLTNTHLLKYTLSHSPPLSHTPTHKHTLISVLNNKASVGAYRKESPARLKAGRNNASVDGETGISHVCMAV